MSEYIEVGQPLQFTDPNTPTRVGEIVENVSDIYNIPSPRLGMQVFVKSKKKSFVITSLKNKVIGGVDVPEAAVEAFEPVGAKSITWNNDTNPSNMNDFTIAGVYDIKGERIKDNDNLPILNANPGHSFNARLTVLDSSISGSGEDDDKCITQVLSFSNRLGQGEVYIRTGKGSSLDNLTWDNWSTLQRNVNVVSVESLDDLIDNGIYSGVLNPTGETFVLVVINNYALASKYGIERSISQFKYSVSHTGVVSFGKRVKKGDGAFTNTWDIINSENIYKAINESLDNAMHYTDETIKKLVGEAPDTLDSLHEIANWVKTHEDLYKVFSSLATENKSAIEQEVNRAKIAEKELENTINLAVEEEQDQRKTAINDIKDRAIEYSNTQTFADKFNIYYKPLSSTQMRHITIPAATATEAGVMSANDKKKLEENNEDITNEVTRAKEAEAELSQRVNNINELPNQTLGGATPPLLTKDGYRVSSEVFDGGIIIDFKGTRFGSLYEIIDGEELEQSITNQTRIITEKGKKYRFEISANTGETVDDIIANCYLVNISEEIEKNAADIKAEVARAKKAEAEIAAKIRNSDVTRDELENGSLIVGQAREIHSRNGKTVTDSFLARTTAGSGTIGDGVASLKSVGGNIVKNLVDGTFESGWKIEENANVIFDNGIATISASVAYRGIYTSYSPVVGHKYYASVNVVSLNGNALLKLATGKELTIGSIGIYSIYTTFESSILYDISPKSSGGMCSVCNPLLIDLTEMFGAGKELDQATCDKLFGTMNALPQGLTIANPAEFKSIGFNQFNPDNVLEGKAIADNAISSGDKKIAVIPCLPCKVGIGENNGYCIHGDFGDDIKVYLTPLNPMEVDGELYMHELTKDATTDTYVPPIKGYLLVEVPTTTNLCAHFLWSEDKCKRDTYEPYFESKVELPTIPQMSEWGLAGIQSNGTLACDEIDFERGVYVKRIGAVDIGSLNLNYNGLKDDAFSFIDKKFITKVKSAYIVSNNSNLNRISFRTDGKVEFITVLTQNTTAFKQAMQGVMLYYELAEPEEYPLPKVDNNYISSDYGVEQFDSAIPCNANNLYYMRSLAGETRNFLDRMYDNTGKSDAKEVADYITNGIEGNKELATNAPNLALRALYIAAGAEYNDTDNIITKTAPWGDSVEHLPKHYYLNGLGDITENEMSSIYVNSPNVLAESAHADKKNRTFILNAGNSRIYLKNSISGLFCNCNKVETIGDGNFVIYIQPTTTIFSENVFYGCTKLKHINSKHIFGFGDNMSFKNWFNGCTALITCKITRLAANVSFFDSPNISYDSILYIINNIDSTLRKSITITLHHDAYTRLTARQEILDALDTKNTALAGTGGKVSLVCATHSEEVTPNA